MTTVRATIIRIFPGYPVRRILDVLRRLMRIVLGRWYSYRGDALINSFPNLYCSVWITRGVEYLDYRIIDAALNF